MFKRLIMAIQFLTIVPLPVRIDWDMARIADTSGVFPLVGLMLGLAMAGAAFVMHNIFSPALTTALVMLALVAAYGGLHLDGLADTFDGIATRGDRQRKLQSMKDSAVGPMGVIAMIFALAIKFLALAELASSLSAYLGALMLMNMASRWAMVAAMYHGAPAREDGLGRAFMNDMSARHMIEATLWATVAIAVPALMLAELRTVAWHVGVILGMCAVYALARAMTRFCGGQFGGHTGDTVGATGELSEITFIMVILIWQRLSIL